MTLSARSIALQGFALSPIAIAVQGLIDSYKEEDSPFFGMGKPVGRAKSWHYKQKLYARTDDLTVEEVQAQWELLELRLKNRQEPAVALELPASVAIKKIAQVMQSSAHDRQMQLEAKRRQEQMALMLVLLEEA